MDLLCTSLLLLLIGQAKGTTHFLYRKEDQKEKMACKHKHWQIDIDYDHKVDCNATLKKQKKSNNEKCKKMEKYIETGGGCQTGKTNRKQEKEATSCLIVNPPKNNGFYACVDTIQSQYIYPFKSPDQNDYFILAFAKKKVLKSLSETSGNTRRYIHKGEPITLTCNFSFSRDYSNFPYVVYWIKKGGKGSTCLYSYDFDVSDGVHYSLDRSLENNFLTRVSNSTSDIPSTNTHHHNLTIKNGIHSDGGQYVCAVNVKKKEGSWAVISTVTVTVEEKELSKQNTTQLSKVNFIPLYVVVTLVIISIFVIAIYMKQKTIIAKECQCVRKQRHQNGDGTINPDIAGREFEPYSVVKLTAVPADHAVKGDQAKLPTEPYSIVRFNSQYNTLGRSAQEDMKHPEKPVDTGAHVYEGINDTYSTCK